MLSELAILAEEKAAETANGAVYDTIISVDDFIECMSNMVEEEEAVSVETSEDDVITFEVSRPDGSICQRASQWPTHLFFYGRLAIKSSL